MADGLLRDQVALVTGASSGIGLAVARRLARDGAAVVVQYGRHREPADALVREIEDGGGRAVAVGADISDEASVEHLFSEAVRAFGTLHVLVGNAGAQRDAAFLDMTLDDWDALMRVDLTGQFLCARAAAREFVRRGPQPGAGKALGKIVFMSSVHQVIPWAGHANYAAAKGGVAMLMQSVAQELAGQRIRVNAIAPGAIRTPINESVWGDPDKNAALMKLIPYGRIGEPEDVAEAALWLCSDLSDYVTGTTLFVDGGMTLYPGFIGNG
jgi:glucose 1-dehydrogenase